jgi:alpha-1,2-mannosyltransferase
LIDIQNESPVKPRIFDVPPYLLRCVVSAQTLVSKAVRSRTGIRYLEFGLGLACLLAILWKLHIVQFAPPDSWKPMDIAHQALSDQDAALLYETVFFGMGIKFQYPPSALFYTSLLESLGFETYLHLSVLNWVLLIANATLTCFVARLLFSRIPIYAYSALFLTGIVYGPLSVAVSIGQIQVFVSLLFTLGFLALLRERAGTAGVFIGIATAIKPQFGLLLLASILHRQWRFVLGFCAAAGIIGALSIACFGWHNHLDYLRVLRFLSERGESYAWNNSVNGILNRLLDNGSSSAVVNVNGVWQSVIPPYNPYVYWPTQVTMALLIGLPPLIHLAKPLSAADQPKRLLLFSITAVCSVIASPIAWIHHFGILLPVYLVALQNICRDEHEYRRSAFLCLAVSFFLTAIRYPFFPSLEGVATLLHAPTFFGALILLGLLLRQFFASARSKSANEFQYPAAAQ